MTKPTYGQLLAMLEDLAFKFNQNVKESEMTDDEKGLLKDIEAALEEEGI